MNSVSLDARPKQRCKPLISYYGGKQRMAPKIVPFIPPHTVYCEPFAGGAAVFYAKPIHATSNNHHYREILNDINGELVNLYRVAKDFPGNFARSIQSVPFSCAVHRGAKLPAADSQAQAIATYVKTHQAFGKIDHGGWARGTFGANEANTQARRAARIQAAADRLTEVFIDNIDFASCISKWDSPHTFFYVDPPYLGTRIDGMGKWTEKDLDALVSCLNRCKGSYILSEYADLRGRLEFEKSLCFRTNCSASGAGKTGGGRNHGEPTKPAGKERLERLYMRGPTHPVRTSLVPILEKQTCFTGPLLGPCPLPLRRKRELLPA